MCASEGYNSEAIYVSVFACANSGHIMQSMYLIIVKVKLIMAKRTASDRPIDRAYNKRYVTIRALRASS